MKESLEAAGSCYPLTVIFLHVLSRVRKARPGGTLISRNLRHYLVDLQWLDSCPLCLDTTIFKYLAESEKYARRQPW